MLIATGALVGCRESPSYFEKLAVYAKTHRSELGALISEIQNQTILSRIIWSDDREFITVIYRDGRIIDGYSDDQKWQPEIRAWIARLKALGCHGFDDDASVTSLYLDIQTYIAAPSSESWRREYASWAQKDRNPDGFRCLDLGDGWYLTVQRH
jgi:hypothetical protein